MPNFFIAGTDVGVGKTYVTCCLLKSLRRRGIQAVGFKPVACGNRTEARDMRDAADAGLRLEEINPVYLRASAEPCMAAELERRSISTEEIMRAYHLIDSRFSPVLVEGVGGWETPLAKGVSTSELAEKLHLPVILVVDNRLGAVSRVLLTLRAVQSRGLECRGLVLNHIGEEWDTAAVTNGTLLESLTGIPVVAELIHGQEDIDSEAVLGY